MELIGRISKGSKMDQVYIPKNRTGFSSGDYVLILPLDKKTEENKTKTKQFKPYFYNTKTLEPIKIRIIEEIFNLIDKKLNPENILITGSFLEEGFKFNDIDILIINEKKINFETSRRLRNLPTSVRSKRLDSDQEPTHAPDISPRVLDIIKSQIENTTGIKTHILLLNNKTLISGLSSDPLYLLMLSKCISKNRLIFNVKREINYKLLDLHLLKSKTLTDNFEILSGDEKYHLVLNMVSILLFVQGKKLSKEIVNKEIEKLFSIKRKEIKQNLINKQDFIKKYKEIYNKTFNLIMDGVKNE